jgi:hypothetical protein
MSRGVSFPWTVTFLVAFPALKRFVLRCWPIHPTINMNRTPAITP